MHKQVEQDKLLMSYTQAPAVQAYKPDKLFHYIVLGTFVLLMVCGGYLFTVKITPQIPRALAKQIQARFVMQRQHPKPKPKPKLKKVEDLTQKPVLAQKQTDIQKKVIIRTNKKVRRVYGLRKVYAKGLGTGGGNASAIVSKLGNTLEKEPDTLQATELDLKGPLVSVSAVSSAPSILKRAKPLYTKEMKEHGIHGVIRAELLIDIDGAVKKVRLLNDLGYGSAASAQHAFTQLKFKPAMRGKEPVAVKIIMKYRFILQE